MLIVTLFKMGPISTVTTMPFRKKEVGGDRIHLVLSPRDLDVNFE